ncbi:MAG: outer membrane lipoprotein-sorting protein [Candidatus Margulisiibacteriota bacterium]
MYKKLFVIAAVALFAFSATASDLTTEDIIANIQANQTKIHDMYAETTTTITSSMTMPGQESKGPQTMVQKGKMWTKGQDKSKIEILSPTRQITITNGDIITVINQDTGQSFTQDLSKTREKAGLPGGGSMDLAKALNYFDLSIVQKDNQYIISGKPKQSNKFLGRMEFYIDSDRWLPVKIIMYTPADKVMSTTEMRYKKISDIWVATETSSAATTPMGAIKTEMVFENVKVNQGIADREFRIYMKGRMQ